jgi:hypothetical protein
MTPHEYAYFQFLMQEIRDLRVENEAMCAMLDNPSFSRKEWRTTTDTMSKDPLFRSAVDANFAGYFDRLRRALADAKTLTQLQQAAATP